MKILRILLILLLALGLPSLESMAMPVHDCCPKAATAHADAERRQSAGSPDCHEQSGTSHGRPAGDHSCKSGPGCASCVTAAVAPTTVAGFFGMTVTAEIVPADSTVPFPLFQTPWRPPRA